MKQQQTLQPKLRFPDFEGGWKKINLSEIAEIKGTKNKLNEILPVLTNSAEKGVIKQEDFFDNQIANDKNLDSYYILDIGEFVYNPRISKQAPYGPINLNKLEKGLLSPLYSIFSLKDAKNLNLFLEIYFKTTFWHKYMFIEGNQGARSDRMAVGKDTLSRLPISIPSLPEQRKIADYLSTVDTKINLLEEKKAQLALYKKAMMQKLFSQEIRFKDDNGNDFPEWESFQLKDILFEHKEKNKSNKYTEVVSVAKEKGVINQIEHLGRSYSAENIEHYKVVNPFDVVYTKSPTSGFPFGIIKQNKLNRSAVLSPLYAVFKPKTIYLGMLLHDLFLSEVETFNYLVPLVQKGAKNTMNINNEDFLNGKKYKLPTSEEEQQKIAEFLSAIDESIEKVNEQITQTQSFKKAMLQQMFV